MTSPAEPGRRLPRRRGFWSRIAHDTGWVSMAGATNTRVEIDAMNQYDREGGPAPSLASRIPGWLLLAALAGIVIFFVFFTGWAR